MQLTKQEWEHLNKFSCPRCGGPADSHRIGEGFPRPGALSRADNTTEVCSQCGIEEARGIRHRWVRDYAHFREQTVEEATLWRGVMA